jgi:Carbohydrate binding module (family 6)/Bacterial Ig-like domain (group 2)
MTKIKYIVTIAILLGSVIVSSQNWNNLTYNPNTPGIESNPMKGFSDLFNPSNNFPTSIKGVLFGLDDIMIDIDSFNWSPIENVLSVQAALGNHTILQVNIDPANGTTDMPNFLDGQVPFVYYPGDPANGIVPDSCPNWNDADLMAAMLNFIGKYGAKYNNDPRVGMVHLGLYGMWGEWHIGEVENIMPSFEMTQANKILIANAFDAAFPDKPLLARYPENMIEPQIFGYSDGLFFGQSLSPVHQYYFYNILKADHADQNWRLHPIGGEIDPSLQNTIWENWPNIVGQDVQACFDSIHPTWLFSHYIFTDLPPNGSEWNNAILAQKKMGYTLYVNKSRLTASGGKPFIEVNIENKGIAPLYANWDVKFSAINKVTGQIKALGSKKCHLNMIQPDNLDNYRSFFSDSILMDGSYTCVMKVVNPLETYSTTLEPLKFANSSQDEDLAGWLTLGDVTITNGVSGTTPIKVTSVSVTPSVATISVGDSILLMPTVLPSNATNKSITWVSDKPGTAFVKQNGQVLAGQALGIDTIRAFTQDGHLIAKSVIILESYRHFLPGQVEAETFESMSGIQTEACSEGGLNVGYIDDGDWMDYKVKVEKSGNFIVEFRVASQSNHGIIHLLNSAGNLLLTIPVPQTGGWQTYQTITHNGITLPIGTYTLRFKAHQGAFNINWLRFSRPSYIFTGATNNQWNLGSNWNLGSPPPQDFDGNVFIMADCVTALGFSYNLRRPGKLVIDSNNTLTFK